MVLGCMDVVNGQDLSDTLSRGFLNPPNSARPRVWWHWMNGNITKDGIRKDLEWMNRVGIGGFQNFDAGLATPQVVAKRLEYMTPEWKDAFHFTTRLADSLGLEMAIAGSPGWSESGGPWVPAKDGMKKYVWSETRLKGGRPFKGTLTHPPVISGTFQGAPQEVELALSSGMPKSPEYYKDVAVIAYKAADKDLPLKGLKPVITSSGGKFTLSQLTDGDVGTTSYLPPKKVGEYAWIQFGFENAVTIRSLNIAGGGIKPQFSMGETAITRYLEVSNNGKDFRKVMDLPLGRVAQTTFSFEPVTGRYFRVNFLTEAPMPNPISALLGIPAPVPEVKGTDVAEINFGTIVTVDKFEEKAGFAINKALKSLYNTPTPQTTDVINTKNVIDLTAAMKADGSLEWKVPEGNWVIVRFGYSLTGRQNHPASPEATGLEVDKLDPHAVKAYIENYLDQYKDASGNLIGGEHALRYIVTDSWEAGTQNWTDAMMEEFSKRRGYSMVPWMPVLTGRIVQSAAASDKFLWDFRLTLAEMVKEYHYDVWTAVLHARKIGRYSESHEADRAFIGDGMAVKSTADVPMSAMWTPGGVGGPEENGPAIKFQTDIMESASVSHLYGQKFVAAESMTAIGNTWAFSPERLKPTADMELASGLNRFVIHTSVHQPVDDKIPGLGLGPFGQWFTRHETWAEEAGAWMDYLARSCYLLQQGRFIADILFFYGEDNNLTTLYADSLPAIPQGYKYDFINSDALTDLVAVNAGKLVTPSGMSYQLLVLGDNARYMSLKVLRKIRELVKAGAVVVGAKPINTPGLADQESEFKAIAAEIWDSNNPNVVSSLEKALTEKNVLPDFRTGGSKVAFVHRKIGDADIYWISNQSGSYEDLSAQFRVSGKTAEIWRPETGGMEKASYRYENDVTTVPLHMEPHEAYFVVFRQSSEQKEFTAPQKKEKGSIPIEGDWQLTFQPGRGAGNGITVNKLQSWTEQGDPGIRYFSGTATYTKSITVPGDWINNGSEIWIDLGEVKNIAEVIVNGNRQRILWRAPFTAEISKALHPGENKLEIKVTNLWVNRLIGDQQPGVTNKITYTTMPFYKKDSPLLLSGLLGPVKLVQKRE